MQSSIYRFLCLAAGVAAFNLVISVAGDNAWSQATRTIRIVVTFPAKSGGDLLTRVIADQIGRQHGVNFLVENADAIKGTEAVSRAAPDGNTLLVLNNNFTANAKLQKPPYDPLTSFIPICNLANGPVLIVVDAASPYRSLGDLLAAAREKPGQIVVAGTQGPPQIAIELLKRAAKVDIAYTATTGGSAPMDALISHRATAAVQLYIAAREQLAANKVRALAITSRDRKEILPDVPTVAESGLPGYEAEYWDGIYAPAGTPADVVAQLAAWFGTAAITPETKATLTAQTYSPVGVCGADFVAFIHREVEEYGRVVREANIKAE
jgi:tripartite-type tricarboxylate transporter receptor subunit TctC